MTGRLAGIARHAFPKAPMEVLDRAEVTIAQDQLSRLGGAALVPGMPVEVFIQTGERSPMAYLLKPLTDYFARALRET